MVVSTTVAASTDLGTAQVVIPLIRVVATIGFAIAPCSLGFAIIAVSEQLIHQWRNHLSFFGAGKRS